MARSSAWTQPCACPEPGAPKPCASNLYVLDFLPHSEAMRVEERYRRTAAETLELVITIVDPEFYSEPWRSDVKRFRRNQRKAERWDEQIYCIPAEEMTYQDLVGTGNVID